MVNLTKGENLNLTKTVAAELLSQLNLGLGWDIRATDGKDFDLDAVAILLGENGKIFDATERSLCFFNQKEIEGVKHSGDNRTGAGDGDDETIEVSLNTLQAEVKEVVLGVVIFEAAERNQNFGQVNNAYVRLYNPLDGNKELARFDLSEDYSAQTVIEMAKLYRHNGEWKFKALGDGFKESIADLFSRYGAN